MYLQTCWQCGAKNEIDDEAGQSKPPVCGQCGAELPTVATLQDEHAVSQRQARRRALSAWGQNLPESLSSYVLISISLIVFMLMVARDGGFLSPSTATIYAWGADFGPASLGPQPWRLVTSMFVHIGILHLVMNMFVLSSIGPLTEKLFGRVGFLAVYLLAGIGGNFVSIAWNPTIVSAGASGAVFGLFGALLGLLLTQRDSFPSAFVQENLSSILTFLGLNIVFGMSVGRINNAAHLGGLATGFLIAVAWRPDVTGWGNRSKLRQGIGLVLALAVLAGVGWFAHRRVAASADARLLQNIYSAAKVTVQPEKEIYLLQQATATDAQRLGQYLQAQGWFKQSEEVTMLLEKDEAGVTLSFPANLERIGDLARQKQWQIEATDISTEVFDKKPVTLNLCNESLKPVETIKSGSKVVIEGKKEIYFWANVTEGEAQSLAQVLRQAQFGGDAEGAYVDLSKDAQGYEITFLVKEGTWDKPDSVAWFKRLATELSASAFRGQRVAIVLRDKDFTVKKTISG